MTAVKKEGARGEPEKQLVSGKPTNNQELTSISQGSQIQVKRIIFYNELLFLNFHY
jgi:hypothetical protein